nr:PfkB family carbohydrate kinase [Tessaracoccus coleopterorum]
MLAADPLVVNEHEGAAALTQLGGPELEDPGAIVRGLRAAGVATVVMTVGSAGSLVADGDGVVAVSSPKVRAVDTVGAGDAFCGALAARLADGATLLDAAAYASRFAAYTVQFEGAQASYPAPGGAARGLSVVRHRRVVAAPEAGREHRDQGNAPQGLGVAQDVLPPRPAPLGTALGRHAPDETAGEDDEAGDGRDKEPGRSGCPPPLDEHHEGRGSPHPVVRPGHGRGEQYIGGHRDQRRRHQARAQLQVDEEQTGQASGGAQQEPEESSAVAVGQAH